MTFSLKTAAMLLAIGTVFGLVGYGIGVAGTPATTEDVTPNCHGEFTMLDPNLDCDRVEESKGKIFTMQSDVNAYIGEAKRSGDITRASVFYRDLGTRRWFGISADEEYYPASLAKLPLAIAYYKVSEIDPTIWNTAILLQRSEQFTNAGQAFGTDSPMRYGNSYAARDMVNDLIIYSDNRLISPLTKFMKQDIWEKTAEDLGIKKQTSAGSEEWSVSPRSIANILRALYNSSYLDPASSDEILTTMTKGTFSGGLVAGIPDGTKIAHKFGEATMAEANGSKTPTLHDCGIVYKPGKPYVICIMTEGKNFNDLESSIAGISKIVYDEQ